MKKQKRNASLDEALRKKWAIRIMLEKEYTKSAAQWMTDRLENLIDYMLYGYALIAYYKQDGTFKFVKATLLPYESHFHQRYDIQRIEGHVVYWDVDIQAWRNFQLENFLEWRPVVN